MKNKVMPSIKDGSSLVEVVRRNGETYYIEVDSEDIERLSTYTWGIDIKIDGNIYVQSLFLDASTGKYRKIYMHRLLMGECANGKYVDHINRNTLDNRKQNLRIVTQLENMQNLSSRTKRYSSVPGVYKARKGFQVRIKLNHINHHLGTFESVEEAEGVALKARSELLPLYTMPN